MKKLKFPLVSIIIVNWNGGEVFRQCLESLSKIDYPNWELIVVDNGSTDGSEKYIKLIELTKLIKNQSNLGFASANNQGYEKTKGKYILLLNNDTNVKPDFLTKLVERIEMEKEIGVIQPKIYMMDDPERLDNAGSFLTRIGFLEHWGFGEKDGPEFEKEKEIFSAKGACMLIQRKIIEKVGLFDSDFVSYFEESDFCWRVWLAGYKILFYPRARIYHKVGFTIRRLDVINLNFHYYKNRISSLIKNLETINILAILPLHLLVSFGIFLAMLLNGKFKESLIIIKAILWNIIFLPKLLKKRTQIQKMRRVGDRELFKKVLLPVNWNKFYGDFQRVEEDLKRRSN